MRLIIFIAFLLISNFVLAQETISEEDLTFKTKNIENIDGYTVTDYYFMLNNDLKVHKVSNKKNVDQIFNKIIESSIKTKSDSFSVAKNGLLLYNAVLLTYPSPLLRITNTKNKSYEIINFVVNENEIISANRAIDIITSHYDSKNAKLVDSYLYFNNKKIRVLENNIIQEKLRQYILSKR